MTTSNSTTSTCNLELIELSNQLHDIAATLAGVSPLCKGFYPANDVWLCN
jgi:hypothetical protein